MWVGAACTSYNVLARTYINTMRVRTCTARRVLILCATEHGDDDVNTHVHSVSRGFMYGVLIRGIVIDSKFVSCTL